MSSLLQTPTRVRYGVLAFACALSMITYLDRVCIGTVAPYMQAEFGLTDTEIGLVFGAFTLAYACFEVPSGWLGDVFGPRRTLIRIVLWWSLFTALTGLVFPSAYVLSLGTLSISLSFVALLVVRFLFGLGEAGAYPNIARAFHNWFPFQERGFAKGTVWMAGRFAGGVTPLAVLILVQHRVVDGTPVVHWRHTFWLFGGMGVIWCALFWWWFRDRPEQKEGVNAAEVALIHSDDPTYHEGRLRVPWGRLLTSGNLWLICAMYFCASYGWYFNITFLPKYLKEQFGLNPGDVNFTAQWWGFTLLAGLPLLFGSVACLLGGLLTDAFIKHTGNRKWGRRLFGILGHGLCAVCYFIAIAMHAPWPFVLMIALAAFWNDMTMGAAWASCLDIGRRYSGIVSGCMNTVGNLGGFMANVITGWVLGQFVAEDKHIAWTLNFSIFGAVYVVAALMWAFFDSTRPVAPDPPPPAEVPVPSPAPEVPVTP